MTYQLIDAAEVVNNIVPIGIIHELPKTESQVRPLVSLAPEQQTEVYNDARSIRLTPC